MLIFTEGGKPENPREKNLRGKGENQQTTQLKWSTRAEGQTHDQLGPQRWEASELPQRHPYYLCHLCALIVCKRAELFFISFRTLRETYWSIYYKYASNHSFLGKYTGCAIKGRVVAGALAPHHWGTGLISQDAQWVAETRRDAQFGLRVFFSSFLCNTKSIFSYSQPQTEREMAISFSLHYLLPSQNKTCSISYDTS
jgi:hypothetical protein